MAPYIIDKFKGTFGLRGSLIRNQIILVLFFCNPAYGVFTWYNARINEATETTNNEEL